MKPLQAMANNKHNYNRDIRDKLTKPFLSAFKTRLPLKKNAGDTKGEMFMQLLMLPHLIFTPFAERRRTPAPQKNEKYPGAGGLPPRPAVRPRWPDGPPFTGRHRILYLLEFILRLPRCALARPPSRSPMSSRRTSPATGRVRGAACAAAGTLHSQSLLGG